jgi:hypothetical protein
MRIGAKDLHLLSSKPKSIKEIVSKVKSKQHLFTLFMKMEKFKGTNRWKVTIMRSKHLDFEVKNELLLHKTRKFQ